MVYTSIQLNIVKTYPGVLISIEHLQNPAALGDHIYSQSYHYGLTTMDLPLWNIFRAKKHIILVSANFIYPRCILTFVVNESIARRIANANYVIVMKPCLM